MDLEIAVCYLCGGAIANIDDIEEMYEEDVYCASCEEDILESVLEDNLMDEITQQEDD